VRDLGTRTGLLGWVLPDAAPTVFSYGVFGLILIVIMLFFPRGLLPAVGDRADALVGRVPRRRLSPVGRAEAGEPDTRGERRGSAAGVAARASRVAIGLDDERSVHAGADRRLP
jgi:hypothetical protein